MQPSRSQSRSREASDASIANSQPQGGKCSAQFDLSSLPLSPSHPLSVQLVHGVFSCAHINGTATAAIHQRATRGHVPSMEFTSYAPISQYLSNKRFFASSMRIDACRPCVFFHNTIASHVRVSDKSWTCLRGKMLCRNKFAEVWNVRLRVHQTNENL
jgi:hypothetical protein